MAPWLLRLAVAAYVVGCAGFGLYLVARRVGPARFGLAAACAGLALQFASYGIECAATRAMVVTSARGSFSLLGLLTVAVLVTIAVRHQLLILGAFVLPLGTLAAAAAALAPEPAPASAVLHGAVFPIHVVASYAGFAGFAAAFGVALAYLLQEREIRSRKPQPVAFDLPPLDVLDRLGARLVLASVALVGAGIATGMLFAKQTAGAWWTGEPKAVATVVSWAIYLAALAARATLGWRGRRTAVMLIVGFVLVLFTFAGLGHRPPVPPSGASV